jgi:hypothetical protein
MLQHAAGALVDERERKLIDVGESEIQSDDHWNQPYITLNKVQIQEDYN